MLITFPIVDPGPPPAAPKPPGTFTSHSLVLFSLPTQTKWLKVYKINFLNKHLVFMVFKKNLKLKTVCYFVEPVKPPEPVKKKGTILSASIFITAYI